MSDISLYDASQQAEKWPLMLKWLCKVLIQPDPVEANLESAARAFELLMESHAACAGVIKDASTELTRAALKANTAVPYSLWKRRDSGHQAAADAVHGFASGVFSAVDEIAYTEFWMDARPSPPAVTAKSLRENWRSVQHNVIEFLFSVDSLGGIGFFVSCERHFIEKSFKFDSDVLAKLKPEVATQGDVSELPDLATKKRVAKWYGCTERHIDAMVKEGKFPAPVRSGERSPRWRRSDLLDWLNNQTAIAMVRKFSQTAKRSIQEWDKEKGEPPDEKQ